MIPTPLISICIPAYNCQDEIKKTLKSVLFQTYHNYEIVISINQSTDNTLLSVKECSKSNPLIRYVIQPCFLSMSENMNASLRMAKGDYIMLLPADDLLADQDSLLFLINLAVKYPKASLIAGRFDFITSKGVFYKKNISIKQALKREWYMPPEKAFLKALQGLPGELSSRLIKRNKVIDEHFIDEHLDRVNTWDLYSRVSFHGGMVVTSKLISYYRLHDTNPDKVLKDRLKTIQDIFFITPIQAKYCSTRGVSQDMFRKHVLEPRLFFFRLVVEMKSERKEIVDVILFLIDKHYPEMRKNSYWPYSNIYKFYWNSLYERFKVLIKKIIKTNINN